LHPLLKGERTKKNMTFSITPGVNVEADPNGVVRHLYHLHEPYTSPSGRAPASLRSLAHSYLYDVAGIYGIDPAMLTSGGEGIAEGPHLEFAEQKSLMGTTTISYVQTYRNLPIWEGGFSMTLQDNPPRVTSSQSTVHLKVDLDEPTDGPGLTPEQATAARVAELLGVKEESARAYESNQQKKVQAEEPVLLRINGTRSLIYRYEPALRYDPESAIKDDRPLSSGPPTLPLPSLPHTIHAGRHYIVTEVLFTLALPEWGELNWRAFIERHTGAVLYLRAFVAAPMVMST
jgi:zinc metalloprotease ZmpB